MKFTVENLSVRKVLGLPLGAAKVYTDVEMAAIAEVVARQMQPRRQTLASSTQTVGGKEQAISVPKWELSPQRVRTYVEEEGGKRQELSAEDLVSLFAKQIDARKAGRVTAHQKRLAKRAEQGAR